MADMEKRAGEGGNYFSSLKRVKKFIDRLDGRCPSEGEVTRIAPDLKTLFDKFSKIRQSCPASMSIDLSDDLWRMLAVAGIANREVKPLRKTGSM